MQFITTTNVSVVDEDLRNAAAAITSGRHGIASRLITINGKLGVGDALAIQQLFGSDAERARLPGVNLDARHGALMTGHRSYAGAQPANGGRPEHPEREEPRFRTDKVAKSVQRTPLLDLTDFKRDLSELTDRLGNAQDCL
tara:strand:- start:490 stop:912 length:423 start_codon:yes stop_codon:yes gene_type:complete